MAEALQFHPDAVAWWQALTDLPKTLGRVRVWRAGDHPPTPDPGFEQHGTTTLVACLRGRVRVEGLDDRCDLAAGEVLLLRAGTWHRHAPLRPGSLAFLQGCIAGRSDFFLDSHDRHLVGSVPMEPSRTLLERAARAAESDRADLIAELIAGTTHEQTRPLTGQHPALLQMVFAIWRHLHQPRALERILAATGLGRAQAFRLCHRHFGIPPAELLRRERLRLAEDLLEDGLGVAETAQRCGFASRRSFTRAYTAATGHCPSERG